MTKLPKPTLQKDKYILFLVKDGENEYGLKCGIVQDEYWGLNKLMHKKALKTISKSWNDLIKHFENRGTFEEFINHNFKHEN